MENKDYKAWLYLLPAILFLGVFMVYPLIDVFVYSFEEGYNSASQTFLLKPMFPPCKLFPLLLAKRV